MGGGGAAVAEARDLIDAADRVIFLTGAGVSAESGIPTFRGPGGLWKRHRPETLATPDAFRADPRLVWEWYAWRQELVAACLPNAAHEAIARFLHARRMGAVVTQNVDGLHGRAAAACAGAAPTGAERPIELHGSLFRVRCSRCVHRGDLPDTIDTSTRASLPRCPDCDGLLRPDVVWFGESLDTEVLDAASRVAAGAATCVVVGTSAVVQPAASIPLLTLRNGGRLIEVNTDATAISDIATVCLQGPAASLLPELLQRRGT